MEDFVSGIEYSIESTISPKPISIATLVKERIVKVENGLLPAIAIRGLSVSTTRLDQQMEHYGVPAVSIAVINNGQIEWAKSYGILEAKTNRAAHVSSLNRVINCWRRT